jgi:hypothetical protein
MASRSSILRATSFDNFASFFKFLRGANMRQLISSGQAETLADIVDARLPADVTLEQRTPKGTIYVYLDNDYFASVSQSGAVKFPPPQYIWHKTPRVSPNAESA